jgi:hypothetical protein
MARLIGYRHKTVKQVLHQLPLENLPSRQGLSSMIKYQLKMVLLFMAGFARAFPACIVYGCGECVSGNTTPVAWTCAGEHLRLNADA